ncbi:hypothetical protein R1sor_019930 [Riccia sorocarpa]|uniref:Epidermal growth factor receptor substrate 15-like 1 n=1 Tax=Riccia sorocarpa TaxID=122646 RepID=A0ABD3IDX1_9MARC
MANLQAFEDYFRRADLDKDGKVSGAEAVSFFQGANLPQPVLAKIWQISDQGSTGFLSKLEFYNALKLVTVAQTGRELTPEIVRSALAGPAAAQIPAPRIVTPGGPPPQPAAPQVGLGAAVGPGRSAPGPTPGGTGGFPDPFAASASGPPASRWQSQPSTLPSQLSTLPSASSQAVPTRPGSASGLRPGSASGLRPAGGLPQDTWPSIRPSASASSLQNYGQQQAQAQPQPQSQPPPPSSAQSVQSFLNGPNAPPPPKQPGKDPFGSLTSSSDLFGGLSNAPKSKPASTGAVSLLSDDPFAASNNKSLVAVTPLTASANNGDAFQGLGDFGGIGFRAETASTMALVPTSVPAPAGKESTAPRNLTQSLFPSSSVGLGAGFSAPMPGGPGSAIWPRMTPADVQRYTGYFTSADTDRDGKITGVQARDLFLSWGLPREVLKQVWDLSDQDGDSALSLREFCTALYLMERFREGRPLPPILPPGIHLDEPPQQSSVAARRIEQARSSVAHHSAGNNVPSWQQNPGMLQPTGSGPGGMPGPTGMPRGLPAGGMERSLPPQGPGAASGTGMPEAGLTASYQSKGPVLEPHLLAQLSRDEQDTLKSRHKDAEEAAKKVDELDKQIMDYKEKAEFYRTKLQEIILFKSRCDNRLGEIQERVAADKREMDALSKRYDERFKASGEVHSRLMAEEAAFRDIQEKKIELYNAIAKMEQGGDANGLLQSKADRIHHDLDELKKALNERSRRLGLEAKASAPTAQSFGWQPGVQDNTSDWDEDWDKFDDEGFVSVQDFMDDATGGDFAAPPPPPKRAVEKVESTLPVESIPKAETSPFSDGFDFSSDHESKLEVPKEVSTSVFSASGPPSPRAESESPRSGIESPQRDLSTSGSLGVEKSAFDAPEKTITASQRYDGVTESDEFGGDVFNDPPAFSPKTSSFDHDTSSYNSGSDAFGGSGASWSTAFNHDDEADSGVRASWGLQSSGPSTQASFDGTGNRSSLFAKSESSAFGDTFDFGSSHVSSPGRATDEPPSPANHRGNGDFRNSEEYDTFAPMGGATFDRSTSLFGAKDPSMGSSYLDTHTPAGNAFSRFDSFSSPGFGAGSEDRHDNTATGSSYFDSPKESKGTHDSPFARFDSFSSVKGADAIHGKSGGFAFDDGDDGFSASAFGGDSKKWNAF